MLSESQGFLVSFHSLKNMLSLPILTEPVPEKFTFIQKLSLVHLLLLAIPKLQGYYLNFLLGRTHIYTRCHLLMPVTKRPSAKQFGLKCKVPELVSPSAGSDSGVGGSF